MDNLVLVNAILFGALVAALIPTESWQYESLVAAAAGAVLWFLTMAKMRRDVRQKEKKEKKEQELARIRAKARAADRRMEWD
jgi:membrane protein implicated in regulation of membrane protease activity